jgi:hypothetical protein
MPVLGRYFLTLGVAAYNVLPIPTVNPSGLTELE